MALPPDRPADDAVPQAQAPLPPGVLADAEAVLDAATNAAHAGR